ncbi:PRC-barrel domain containing protein [Halorubrum sp. HHNYT27]|uniref:PRC-barrel domain containing protein n=1 Tax=Halorubrum sp. HHNYT27 TaxID=3402275 RepID=UPI003EB94E56
MPRSVGIEDEGKQIMSADGSVIGWITVVEEDGTAYVRPKPGLMEGWSSWICGPECCEEAFPLDRGTIVDVDDEAVVVEPRRAPLSAVNEK